MSTLKMICDNIMKIVAEKAHIKRVKLCRELEECSCRGSFGGYKNMQRAWSLRL